MFGNDSTKRFGETNPDADPGAEMPPPANDPADEIRRLLFDLFFGVLRIKGVPLCT